jgi:hypothetical protein
MQECAVRLSLYRRASKAKRRPDGGRAMGRIADAMAACVLYSVGAVSPRLAHRAHRALLVRCCTYVTLCCLSPLVQTARAQERERTYETTGRQQLLRDRCVQAHAEAQQRRMHGSLLAAREELLVCGRNDCPTPVMNDCAGWLNEVEASLSSIVFAVSDEDGHDIVDASVRADGKLLSEQSDGRALTLDPGTYTFSLTAPRRPTVEITLSVRQSEKNRIVRVELPPPRSISEAPPTSRLPTTPSPPVPAAAQPHPVPLVSYILAGTTLIGVGGFVYFGLSGNALHRQWQHCTDDCSAVRRTGKRNYVLADIALGVAIVSLPAAIITYLVARPDRDGSQQTQNARQEITPLWLPGGAGLQWRTSF